MRKRTWRDYLQLGLSTRDMESDLVVPVRDAYVEWLELRDLSVRSFRETSSARDVETERVRLQTQLFF